MKPVRQASCTWLDVTMPVHRGFVGQPRIDRHRDEARIHVEYTTSLTKHHAGYSAAVSDALLRLAREAGLPVQDGTR